MEKIILSDSEKRLIKITKGHYENKYPYRGNWVLNMKPLFEEIYRWNPNTDIRMYKNVLWNALLEIFLKIQDDSSGTNINIKNIFSTCFYRSISRDFNQPIERGINELCGLIQATSVLSDGGKKRFDLN